MRFSPLVLFSLFMSGTLAVSQTAFTAPAIYPAIAGDAVVRSADFNHDGKPDLLVQSADGDQNFTLYLNDGTGKFGAAITVPNNNLGRIDRSIVADVNGDGFPDIVAAENGGLVVYLNDGTAHFTATLQQPLSLNASGFVVGDVDQDGHLDVMVGVPQNSLLTFFGDGKGNFGPPVTQTNINLDLPPTGTQDTTNCAIDDIAGGDFFLDNQFSLFVTSLCTNSSPQEAGTIFLAHGDGTGHFTFTPSTATGGRVALATTINGAPNGRPNVVYTLASSEPNYQQLSLATNNGGGNFTYSLIEDNSSDVYGYAFQDLSVADFNGDGIPDIATTALHPELFFDYQTGPARVSVYTGSASGAFTRSTSINIGGDNASIRGIAAGDFNGDGFEDLATLVEDDSYSANITNLYVYDGFNGCSAPTAANSNLICTPANGATATSPVTVTAASNVAGLTLNRIYLDNQSVYQTTSAMVSTSLTAASGSHRLVLVSYNNKGQAFSSTSTFTVGSTTSGCVPAGPAPNPNVTICSPAAGATTGSPVTISAAVSALAGYITAMRGYIDGTVVFTVNNPTNSVQQAVNQSVSVAPGSHTLVMIGYQNNGYALKGTEAFTVTGSAACYPSSAGAEICSPAQNATASSPVTVVAGATAGSGYLTAVRVYVDNVAKTLINNPQQSKSFAINTPVTLAAGKHSIVVVGYQSTGGSVSASDSVTVQ